MYRGGMKLRLCDELVNTLSAMHVPQLSVAAFGLVLYADRGHLSDNFHNWSIGISLFSNERPFVQVLLRKACDGTAMISIRQELLAALRPSKHFKELLNNHGKVRLDFRVFELTQIIAGA